MKWQSMLAVYFRFGVVSVFFVLPFGVKTPHEAGVELVPGQAESAPHGFSLKRTAIRTTIVATVLFAIFFLNYQFGWVTPEMLDWSRGGTSGS